MSPREVLIWGVLTNLTLNRYVKVYEASLFALAVQRPNGLLNHEEVVKQLTDLTVSYDVGLGIRGDFPEVMQVVLKVEKHQYQNAIAWYVAPEL